MRNLLEFILLHLVQNPDAVEVEELELEDNNWEYVIRVHAEDVGRVIGRQGSTIQAIRTLAKVRAMQDGTRVRISVESDVQSETPSEEAAE
jgi:predicted RNA-binding protein YlqC (UPF0109 family)